MSYKHQA